MFHKISMGFGVFWYEISLHQYYYLVFKFLGSIHNWGTKKEWLLFKGLQRITLDFCLSYIIIAALDCCMLINNMMSC
jgi:hypothetical protein